MTTRPRTLSQVAAAGAVAMLLVVGGWAARSVLAGPDPTADDEIGYVLAEAVPGAVEQSLSLNASARWTASGTVSNQRTGTVTEVFHAPGEPVDAGEVLYSVDLRPVVAAIGSVPAFRSMESGDTGADVAQLQELLASEGYFDGEANGMYDNRLYWAVWNWQRDLGVSPTGTVTAGDLLFVPALPVNAALTDDIAVGAQVAAGTVALNLLPDAPEFWVDLPEGQARLVEPGMEAELDYQGETWRAVVLEVGRGEQDTYVARLAGPDGASLCADACGLIPLGEPTLIRATMFIIPRVEGITIPAGAITTGSDGQTVVVTEAGGEVPVEVVVGAGGMAVVEGLDAGTSVRVPGGAT